ncbi:MAG: hypothetical protein HAW60_01495 [Bdellovibrionales bacterium]|nr:hypothetical protein [Bdellovibrionales bacterium]
MITISANGYPARFDKGHCYENYITLNSINIDVPSLRRKYSLSISQVPPSVGNELLAGYRDGSTFYPKEKYNGFMIIIAKCMTKSEAILDAIDMKAFGFDAAVVELPYTLQ